MPRTPPRFPESLSTLPAPQITTWELTLQTITPMFGGSAVTREGDPKHPVRSASVRGHLRFWWRATAGAGYRSAEKLFEAEEVIWGSAERHGMARVEVETLEPGVPVRPTELGVIRGRSPAQVGPLEGFFVYPFRANQEAPEASGLRGIKFRLKVRLDPKLSAEQQDEVKTALRAWIAFGGVGARTRRGCGALSVTGENAQEWTPKNTAQLCEWFAEEGNPKAEHSVLQGGRMHFSDPHPEVETKVWRDLGRFWARFRKGHYTERRPEYSPMSGSSWQDHRKLLEADRRRSWPQKMALSKPFLGLPIVYQNFQGKAFGGTLDASAPHGKRMASPVILKPVQFQDGVRGMVLILNAPHPEKIKIGSREIEVEVPQHEPMFNELNVRGPLAAVSAAAKRDGYTEEVKL